MVLWLDSSLGITQSGTVSAWADQSGLGNNFTFPVQPTYNASDAGYGGKPSLGFTGTQYGFCVNSLALAQPYTIILVCKNPTSGTYILANKTGANVVQMYNVSGNGQMYSGVLLSTSTSVASPCVFAGVFNGASSSAYVNNSASAAASGNAGASTLQTPELAAATESAGFMTGTIASLLIYSRGLTTAQLHSVFSYLGARFGIAAS